MQSEERPAEGREEGIGAVEGPKESSSQLRGSSRQDVAMIKERWVANSRRGHLLNPLDTTLKSCIDVDDIRVWKWKRFQ